MNELELLRNFMQIYFCNQVIQISRYGNECVCEKKWNHSIEFDNQTVNCSIPKMIPIGATAHLNMRHLQGKWYQWLQHISTHTERDTAITFS